VWKSSHKAWLVDIKMTVTPTLSTERSLLRIQQITPNVASCSRAAGRSAQVLMHHHPFIGGRFPPLVNGFVRSSRNDNFCATGSKLRGTLTNLAFFVLPGLWFRLWFRTLQTLKAVLYSKSDFVDDELHVLHTPYDRRRPVSVIPSYNCYSLSSESSHRRIYWWTRGRSPLAHRPHRYHRN
jgi:hypothetical protein